MYEIDSANFTSKSNPKQEFIHYFKDSGAAAAVQRAMTLLYRMPVKPTNLAEYFSQYFENGAQQLMRISLLKAELCYKRGELQNRLDKIKESEKNIEKLCNMLAISQEEFNERFVPKHIKERYRLSILERYFKDMEKGIEKTLDEVSDEVTKNITVEVNDNDEYGSNYDSENDCLRDVQSDHAIRQDMIELDPWGIICKAPKEAHAHRTSDDRDQHNKPKSAHTQKHHKDWHGHSHRQSNHLVQSEISLLMDGNAGAYPDDEHEQDDDDAATLAELFCSNDGNVHEQDDDGAMLHNQLLTVRKADKVKMADFMGWTPLQSRENLLASPETGAVKESMDAKSLRYSTKKPLTEYDLFDVSNLDDSDFEDLKQRPCYQTMMELLQSQQAKPKSSSPKVQSAEQDTDAFLFEDDDDMDKLYKMMESAQHSFDYELTQHSRTPTARSKEEICEPVCSAPEVAQMCDLPQPGLIECPCGEMQCQCPPPENVSMDFPPGKMINWTHDFEEYPCSLTEYGEYVEGIFQRSRKCSAQSPKLPAVPLVRVDSSCHCILSGMYSTSEILGEIEEDEAEVLERKKKVSRDEPFSPEDLKDERKRASGDAPAKVDEQTNTEVPLEQELDEVFKVKRHSKVSSAGTSGPRKSVRKQESVDDIEDNTFFATDVFGIDLAKEVKRDIIGLTDSEVNATGTTKQSIHGRTERKSHNHHIQKHKSTSSSKGENR
ncbi:hypothetical protein Ocin01_04898 [Orchesella cincta]|uniref:Uncharacterized protein n=1 Tax=Orchesella cincta TaxID=48709 RepID=A0A1D2N936_ORCCI|nr:hypothetical protein Ocin01_04898 [Orchesella cincta]